MKVVIIIDRIGGGGGEVFVKKVRDRLIDGGDKVEILSGEDELSTRKVSFSERSGFFRLIGIVRASRELKREIARINPDLLLILSPLAAIATISALPEDPEFKTVYAPRFLVLDDWSMIEGGMSGKVKQILERGALQYKFDRIFALTENMRERMRDAGAIFPVEIVPIGVDTEEFSPLGRKSRKPRVLFVGRFEAVKGIDIFVEASKHFENVEFVMLGDNEEKLGELPSTVKVEGKVSHEEMIEYYNKARVVALPSYSEGLPRVCLEALACETPVIASNVGGVPELVIDGETGFLVEPGDVDQLVEKIKDLLDDPELAEEMGQRGRAHILKNFDEEKIMKKTIQALRRISEENSRD